MLCALSGSGRRMGHAALDEGVAKCEAFHRHFGKAEHTFSAALASGRPKSPRDEGGALSPKVFSKPLFRQCNSGKLDDGN
jgi:hypothetical protein